MARTQTGKRRPGKGDFEVQNYRRAERARRALVLFQGDAGLIDADGLDTAVADLICDLMHLCDRSGLDLIHILCRARMHHDAEVREGYGAQERGR
jgi:hypothetical protein